MSVLSRIRAAFSGPPIDADGWYAPGAEPQPAPEYGPTWADPDGMDEEWVRLDRQRRNANLGVALPCVRWTRASEHESHVWDHDGSVAQCPGWRGEP